MNIEIKIVDPENLRLGMFHHFLCQLQTETCSCWNALPVELRDLRLVQRLLRNTWRRTGSELFFSEKARTFEFV